MRSRLISPCEAQPEQLIELHPNLPELYRRRVEALEAALQEPEGAAAAAQALRSLIDAVMFYPEDGRGQYRLELRGDCGVSVRGGGLKRQKPGPILARAWFVLMLGHRWLRGHETTES